ncbi:TPA: LysR family transcriptional regulator [Candidatus Gastranaerophilales bacterium HUM_20]|nr:transcriptional regulator LysR family [Clostridium sp. CAG:729]DAB24455.1 MAG TPA: LysR family transcriptional regulator [Candidatus Gastranaerophilales bacterium HUM_20]
MEIRVLKYFLTVSEIGNITKAANLMHLTQPTLSRQLLELEKELGQKLFIRGNHSVSLTPEGIMLRKRAQEIIDLVDKTEAEFTSFKDEIMGDIFIGSGETKSIKLITDVMKTLKKDYPKIKFHIVSGDSGDLVERLDKGLLDFCVLIQPFNLEKYDYIDLGEKDTWGLLLRKDDPLADKKSIKIEDLMELPLIISRQAIRKTDENNVFLNWFGNNFENLIIAGTYNLIYNAAIMTEDRIGYAMGLDKLINTTANTSLCFRPLTPKLEVGISVVWKKNQVFSRPAKLFLEQLRKKLT